MWALSIKLVEMNMCRVGGCCVHILFFFIINNVI
jgi:hypothetical protein